MELSDVTRWWHGGPRIEGDLLLPPDDSGGPRSGHRFSLQSVPTEDVRTDQVFVVSDRLAAVMFASGWTKPWIYEVEPVGELLLDEDFEDDGIVSAMCGSARILRREKPSNHLVQKCQAMLAPR